MLKRISLIILFLLITTNLYAFNIVGTWKLIDVERKVDNQWKPDCNSPQGLLIYTKNGYMAAGLNCMQPKDGEKPSFAEKDVTFYMGTYTLKQDLVTHHVTNASSAIYYNQNLARKIQILSSDRMNLVVKTKTGQLIRLQWKKVNDIE